MPIEPSFFSTNVSETPLVVAASERFLILTGPVSVEPPEEEDVLPDEEEEDDDASPEEEEEDDVERPSSPSTSESPPPLDELGAPPSGAKVPLLPEQASSERLARENAAVRRRKRFDMVTAPNHETCRTRLRQKDGRNARKRQPSRQHGASRARATRDGNVLFCIARVVPDCHGGAR